MRITPLIGSSFVSDGGAMFGLVPKPIWSRLIQPNEKNGIPQNANCLLLETADGKRGLVDTGCGPEEKFSEKERGIHGLSPGWPLMEALRAHGLTPDDIDFVVLTHLHWDHGGGASTAEGVPTFPHATHFLHALEWEAATSGDPLLYRSYPENVVAPLADLDASRLVLVEKDDVEVMPGMRLVRSGGHTRGHCTVVLEGDLVIDHKDSVELGRIDMAVFAGDVCPMQHNLRMVFQTAYDTFPLETRAWKTKWLPEIARRQALLMFDHDPDAFGVTIQPDERREYVAVRRLLTNG